MSDTDLLVMLVIPGLARVSSLSDKTVWEYIRVSDYHVRVSDITWTLAVLHGV